MHSQRSALPRRPLWAPLTAALLGAALLTGGCATTVNERTVAYAPGGVEAAVSVRVAPPPLPEYDQPPCPGDGYLWTPGYWRWSEADYFWVPGTWVLPPAVGVLWTPGYWGWSEGAYVFHEGYWGPHVGFYGGVNYGFGYTGVGFSGGYWSGGAFTYNRAVANVNTTVVRNTYVQNTTIVTNNNRTTNVSYNGGAGGTTAVPSPQERAAARERHEAATPVQREHVQQSMRTPALAARANSGHPPIAATGRPARFDGPEVVGARGAQRPATSPEPATRPDALRTAPRAGERVPSVQASEGRDQEARVERERERGREIGAEREQDARAAEDARGRREPEKEERHRHEER